MSESFFERPILNSPYEYPAEHWELDPSGQPTNQVIPRRRPAQYLSPIPQAKKRRAEQQELDLASASRLSTERQKYDPRGAFGYPFGVSDSRREGRGGC